MKPNKYEFIKTAVYGGLKSLGYCICILVPTLLLLGWLYFSIYAKSINFLIINFANSAENIQRILTDFWILGSIFCLTVLVIGIFINWFSNEDKLFDKNHMQNFIVIESSGKKKIDAKKAEKNWIFFSAEFFGCNIIKTFFTSIIFECNLAKNWWDICLIYLKGFVEILYFNLFFFMLFKHIALKKVTLLSIFNMADQLIIVANIDLLLTQWFLQYFLTFVFYNCFFIVLLFFFKNLIVNKIKKKLNF